MVSVRDAAQSALSFYKDIYPSLDGGELVEEVELDENKKYWIITLSFPVEVDQTSTIVAAFSPRFKRVYKVFKIDAQNGQVESMKIKQLQYDPS